MNELELVTLQAAEWGLRLEGGRLARLEAYARLLAGYEEANVIGTREIGRILLDHVLDSLGCFLFRPLADARRLADVGSGGGLPGLPIKICAPGQGVTLIESTGKKARFLRRVIDELSLTGTEVVNARVEDASRMVEHRGMYDVATARAVARLSVLAEYCVPLLKVGGWVVSMKGRLPDEELSEGERAADKLGARVSELIRVPHLPEVGEKERCLVVIQKVRETPGKYPRNVGMPAKKPLGVV
jgi:16S rRNA (guanine527-N7)-methyltransferase